MFYLKIFQQTLNMKLYIHTYPQLETVTISFESLNVQSRKNGNHMLVNLRTSSEWTRMDGLIQIKSTTMGFTYNYDNEF